MTKNTTVETAQKSQATTKNTGKVKTLANATERRKAREEQFRNFRINALKRRCARYGFDEAKTNEYIEKLKKQMDAPKEYSILITFDQAYPRKKMKEGEVFKPDIEVFLEDIKGKNISYAYKGDSFVRIDGNQDILAKIREIAPPSAKIYPYARKMEPVIPTEEKEVIKKPSNNTAEKKAAAKAANKGHMPKSARHMHRLQKGRTKTLADIRRAYKSVKKNLKKGEKIDVKKVFKVAEERKKGGAGTIVQLNTKKSSTGSKKASTNVKKAA